MTELNKEIGKWFHKVQYFHIWCSAIAPAYFLHETSVTAAFFSVLEFARTLWEGGSEILARKKENCYRRQEHLWKKLFLNRNNLKTTVI